MRRSHCGQIPWPTVLMPVGHCDSGFKKKLLVSSLLFLSKITISYQLTVFSEVINAELERLQEEIANLVSLEWGNDVTVHFRAYLCMIDGM